MAMKFPSIIDGARPNRGRLAVAGAMALALSACAAPPPPAQIHDPLEGLNRGTHALNRGLDRYLLRPASRGYGTILPQPVRTGVSNVAGNLDLPGDMVNGVLQADPAGTVQNFFRFVVNTTVGIGGLFDPATAIGIPHDQTDFGETLHVWGFGEGPYLEMPGFGPSTVRDGVGIVTDLVMNPMSITLPSPESDWATAFKLGSKLGDRDRYSDTIDSILYDSADSYAQARLLYLQNRRFELGQTGAGSAADDDGFIDPYEE